MEVGKVRKAWERTNVTNLLRNGQSGSYYARVKVNGKEKWRSLKTKVFSVAKLKVSDVERSERAKGAAAVIEALPDGGETKVTSSEANSSSMLQMKGRVACMV